MSDEHSYINAHAADLLALAGVLRSIQDLVHRLEANPHVRADFFQGRTLAVPLQIAPNEVLEANDHGAWLRIGCVGVDQVVEDALDGL